MPQQNLTFEQVSQIHPDEVQRIIGEAKKGKSKYKNTAPETWKWSYLWGEGVNPSAFYPYSEKPTLSLEERVNIRVNNCKVFLKAELGKKGVWKTEEISSQFIYPFILESEKEKVKEEQRLAAMSEEERLEEFRSALNQLAGQSGFFVLKVDSKETP